MNLSAAQIESLAPDSASVSAGRKLSARNHWKNLGRSEDALWGECQGSALYQVRVDLADLGSKCTCPSRKFPCKHALGLLMLAASDATLPTVDSPVWVNEWVVKRRERSAERENPKAEAKPVDPATAAKRAERREKRVDEGIEALQLWLADLVRNGLAGLDAMPPQFWQDAAARLVDAQAPGLASRVGRIGTLPGSSPEWPEQVLGELGRLALLLHAYGRLDSLDTALQADIRQLIGWNIPQEDLDRDGERVTDEWVVFGQWEDVEDRLRVQRSWLAGRRTERVALVLQFAAGANKYGEIIVPGTSQEAELVFYPGAYPQRARILRRTGTSPNAGSLPAAKDLTAFLEDVAVALGRQPWLERFGCVLRNVTPVRAGERWHVRDADGNALPLLGGEHWAFAALSGGYPVDVGGEWDGYRLRALSVAVDNRLRLLG